MQKIKLARNVDVLTCSKEGLVLLCLSLVPACQLSDASDSSSDAQSSFAVSSPNLALNKPVTSSVACRASQGPAKAVNGSVSGGINDKWCSHASGAWLRVDLGAEFPVSQFVVKHAGAGGERLSLNTRDFNIRVSSDGVFFATVVSATGNTSNVSIHDIPVTNARYVYLKVVTPSSTRSLDSRIYELEVYGPPQDTGSGGASGTGGNGSGGLTGAGGSGTGGFTGTGGTGTGGLTGAGGAGTGGFSSAGTPSFFDDFNTPSLNSAWAAIDRHGDFAGGDLACLTPNRLAITGGNLVITSLLQAGNCGDATHSPVASKYSSGMVQWRSINFTYGTLEARAKFPGGVGPWPAIWLLGANCQASNIVSADNIMGCDWPNPGSDEIDFIEILTNENTRVNQQIHSAGNNSGCWAYTTDVSQNYHTYKLDWRKNSLVWSIDGVQTCSLTSGVPTTPMFVIMNTSIFSNVVDSTLPQSASIDYIRLSP